MEVLKFGIIGLFIMLPFILVSYLEDTKDYYEIQTRQFIVSQLEEASYDASFSIKTYSEFYYDSDDEYHISIPYEQVVDVFFTSLEFRNFDFSYGDFPFLVFIDYDGVIIYHPLDETFYPKLYYSNTIGNEITYITLSNEAILMDKLTGDFIEATISQGLKEKVVLETIDRALNKAAIEAGYGETFVFSPPIAHDSSIKLSLNDLSFAAIYRSQEYFGIGLTEVTCVKPSGVMKIEEITW